LNASFAEDGREFKAEINIGLAVALRGGLIVPVLHGCDKLSVLDIATQANPSGRPRRSGKPSGKICLVAPLPFNMGMLPVEHFTAINQPAQARSCGGASRSGRSCATETCGCAHHDGDALCDHLFWTVYWWTILAELKKLLEIRWINGVEERWNALRFSNHWRGSVGTCGDSRAQLG